jgi:Recombination endonuclease VII.
MGHYNQQRQGRPLAPLRRTTDPTARDAHGRKQCRRCEAWLATESFCTNKARPDGLAAYCRRCERDKALIHNYGITLAQWEVMFEAQGGGCAICGRLSKGGKPLFVDHDHACCAGQRTCGRCVRALLCGDCNLGIGYFTDSIDRLEEAVAYLARHARRRS